MTSKFRSFSSRQSNRPCPIVIKPSEPPALTPSNDIDAGDQSSSPLSSKSSPSSSSCKTSSTMSVSACQSPSPLTTPSTTVFSDEPVKIVFLGEARVGKTSIIRRFLHNQFETKYTPTIEDIYSKKFAVRGQLVRLTLIDTAGSLDFPAMLRLCIAKANAFVIVFAHDNANSLRQAGNLLAQIKAERKDYAPLMASSDSYRSVSPENEENPPASSPLIPASPPITVVCNKSDLPPTHSEVGEGAVMEWLLTNSLKPSQFVYTSAKSNESIRSIFESLWSQNELTGSIQFEPFERAVTGSSSTTTTSTVKRRASFNSSYSFSSSSSPSSATTNFSAIASPLPNKNGNGTPSEPNNNGKSSSSQRMGLFRNSLRLSRRSNSNKWNKTRPDVVPIECVLC